MKQCSLKRVINNNRQNAMMNILTKIQQPSNIAVKCENIICSNCDSKMVLDDIEYICVSCGMRGSTVECNPASYSNTSNKCYNNLKTNDAGNGTCNSSDDNSNAMYDATMRRLRKMHTKSRDIHIPLDILRQTAREYVEICRTLKEKRDKCQDGKKKNPRNNIILPALLNQCLDKSNMSKPSAHICQFIGKPKCALTKSNNKLEELMTSSIPMYRVDVTSKICSFAYQFLARLDLNASLTDVVTHIILRADIQIDMKNYRPCQDKTKVIGTIWLLIRQIGYRVHHSKIKERCFKISKSTYVRYVEFLDINRRRVNPKLIRYNIRPIPRSFAESINDNTRGRKKLEPIPEKYSSLFMKSE